MDARSERPATGYGSSEAGLGKLTVDDHHFRPKRAPSDWLPRPPFSGPVRFFTTGAGASSAGSSASGSASDDAVAGFAARALIESESRCSSGSTARTRHST